MMRYPRRSLPARVFKRKQRQVIDAEAREPIGPFADSSPTCRFELSETEV